MKRILSLALALALPASAVTAQTLMGVDSEGQTISWAGPKDPAFCNYPSGPLLGLWNNTNGAFCFALDVPLGAFDGDIAVDRVNNTHWVTDGIIFAEQSDGGSTLQSYEIPGALQGTLGSLTGLGYESANNRVWATDGTLAVAFTPAAPGGCPEAGIDFGPFALNLPGGGIATDIEWDSRTGTLWVCDSLGLVHNLDTSGALVGFGTSGPVVNGPCGLGTVLHGLAIDEAATTGGKLWVTDGTQVYYMDAGTVGGPAPSTFYASASCSSIPLLLGEARGLAFTARALRYGFHDVFPSIGNSGQAIVPNLDYEISIAGANENDTAVLLATVGGPLCPSIFIGTPLYIVPVPLFIMAAETIPDTGIATFPFPLLPTFPTGISAQVQWVTLEPAFLNISGSTGALSLTLSRP